MWKHLFAEPPPNAVENLLTPRRKFVYGVIAFAPGTLLALYLNSVKKRMNEENEALRLKHINEELAGEVAREQKDLVLTQMIQELRSRIEQLEREARSETVAAKSVGDKDTLSAPVHALPSLNTKGAESYPLSTNVTQPVEPQDQQRTEIPYFLVEYEDTLRPWLDRFDALKSEIGKLQTHWSSLKESGHMETNSTAQPPTTSSSHPEGVRSSGIRDRVHARQREMGAQDVREHKSSSNT